ncbi:MAG: hypothetical protein QHC88_16755 [Achromobacter sp.]|uniref:hypothetical protein n=1 Tax=Achromobacter sp. TaxID=134375 RepID=UPI0029B20516|nr:hypothetical protein [Achromobacter sp.]MDX3986900.1 hypothetical protein [Achromobacter sp.]
MDITHPLYFLAAPSCCFPRRRINRLNEQIGMSEANLGRDAAALPIAHALDRARLVQDPHQLGHFRGAAVAIDDFGMWVQVIVHKGLQVSRLNTMFINKVNTACINNSFAN